MRPYLLATALVHAFYAGALIFEPRTMALFQTGFFLHYPVLTAGLGVLFALDALLMMLAFWKTHNRTLRESARVLACMLATIYVVLGVYNFALYHTEPARTVFWLYLLFFHVHYSQYRHDPQTEQAVQFLKDAIATSPYSPEE